MALLDDVKQALRITGSEHNGEIEDLIAAAKAEFVRVGLDPKKVEAASEPLIKLAIINYCRAQFDWDHPNIDRLQRTIQQLQANLSLSGDYRAQEGE